jgi:hypothetical protein
MKMAIVLLLALSAAFWSSKVAAQRTLTAQRLGENERRIVRASQELHRLMPQTLEGEAAAQVNSLVDEGLRTASIPDASLRSRSVRTLGPLGDTGVLKFQEHVEVAGISQSQAASLVATLEETSLPLVLAAADLSEGAGESWNLVLDLSWLERAGNPR